MNNISTSLSISRDTDELLDILYQKYFVNFQGHSEVTSSHWSSIGQQNVCKADGRWDLAGIGFGSAVPPNTLNKIKRLPQTFLLNKLLQHYEAPAPLVLMGREIASQMDRLFDFDCVKQILSLAYILSNFHKDATNVLVICVIGDGYGYLTSLIHRALPLAKVLCVNLGRTLLFDMYYTRRATTAPLGLITQREERDDVLSRSTISFLEAENFDWLEEMPIDLFINIASMQEMNNTVIKRYFELMRSSQAAQRYFYCCNRLQKNLPDGESVSFMQYPWNARDRMIFDELCPWYQRYPASRPPFWRPFDGPTQHRLVELAAS